MTPECKPGLTRHTTNYLGVNLTCDFEFDDRPPAEATLCHVWINNTDIFDLLGEHDHRCLERELLEGVAA